MEAEKTVDAKERETLDPFDAHRRNRAVEEGVITDITTEQQTATLHIELLYGDTRFTHALSPSDANAFLEERGYDPTSASIHELSGVNVPVTYTAPSDTWKLNRDKTETAATQAREKTTQLLTVIDRINVVLSLGLIVGPLVLGAAAVGASGPLAATLGLAAVLSPLVLGLLKIAFAAVEMTLWGSVLSEWGDAPSPGKHVRSYQKRDDDIGLVRRAIKLLVS